MQMINKEMIDIPEPGYIYFGYDDGGLWIRKDDGTVAYYILTGEGGSAPSISYLSPTIDIVGSTINIIGNNFIQGGTTVTFGGSIVGLSVTVLSVTSLTVVVPYISPGSVSVVVTTSYGSSVPVYFTVSLPSTKPSISNITPSPASVGELLYVNGSNFVIDGTTLYFGSYSGITSCKSTIYLSVTVPEITNGVYNVTVQTITPDSSNPVNLTIGVSLIPTITSFYPDNAYTGDTISIIGSNFFTEQTNVSFGQTIASNVTVTSETSLEAVVGASTQIGTMTVLISNDLGGNSLSGFTVIGDVTYPTIISILPLNQPAGGTVTLSGTNFNTNGNPLIVFGEYTATIISLSATGCTVKLNSSVSSGSIPVSLNNGYGTATYTYSVYTPPLGPVITGFNPDNGSVGDIISISGTNFTVGVGNAVYFGGVVSTVVNGVSSTQITAKIPTWTPSGIIGVTITTIGGSFTKDGFTINTTNPPTITSIGPSNQYGAAGSDIHIYGTNFSDPLLLTQGTTVSFGSTYMGTTFSTSYIDSTHVVTTLPLNIVGDGQFVTGYIFITTNSGSCSSNSTFDIYKQPIGGLQAPVITSFSPTSGNAGTEIIINGNFFCKYWTSVYGVVSLYYVRNGVLGYYPAYVPLNNYQWISINQIKATTPTTFVYTGPASIYVNNQAGSATKVGFTIT
jgi:hypothetical protein